MSHCQLFCFSRLRAGQAKLRADTAEAQCDRLAAAAVAEKAEQQAVHEASASHSHSQLAGLTTERDGHRAAADAASAFLLQVAKKHLFRQIKSEQSAS